MPSKQKVLAIAGLLFGAVAWGLIWYPLRLLEQAKVSGALSTFATYTVALLLGALFFRRSLRQLRPTAIVWRIGLSAGWANLAYVLAVIQGEVMRVLLLFYLAPLWTVVLARLLLAEEPAPPGWAVMLLSLGGALMMLWHPAGGLPLPGNSAEWLGLSAGLMFALSNVLTRRAQEAGVVLKSVSVWCGASLLALVPLFGEPAALVPLAQISWHIWLALAALGGLIFAVTLAVQYGLSHTPANQAIVIFLSELVVAAVSAYFLAHEALSPREWLGGAMIVAASLFSGKLEAKPDSGMGGSAQH